MTDRHGISANPPTPSSSIAKRPLGRSWAQLDPETHPFVRLITTQLAEHDDREQFLAGIDLLLAGIEPLWDATPPRGR